MRVVWSLAALAHLEAIADYIAQDSPAAALRLVQDITERTDALLADNPLIGRKGRAANTRELVMTGTPYLVVYRPGERVEVLAVRHGSRAWPPAFPG